ncbi:Glycosyl transferases group 1 [Sphingomonas guangdongensis]|uniref:Glycosyl transferases group 1 n=1 Tax=Sphingomonas guangdongensis TaxID=1141890 RepID=A0A285QGX5_9SPHN|nr:glycosyltransferase family 4 protein [Sphingomonas guangdongensis]SOB81096.1 Glycosyl transferases group 1 [Sphingomonas guangdongensis]
MGTAQDMNGRTPAAVAAVLDAGWMARAARGVSALLNGALGHRLSRHLPGALTGRLHRLAARVPPRTTVHGSGAPGRQYLLVGHDLSLSGAPQLLLEIARLLVADGRAVTLMTPEDGPLRTPLVEAGATVIVDPLLLRRPERLLSVLAGSVDGALCNSVVTAAAVTALAPRTPVIWYVHEVSVLQDRMAADPALGAAFALPARLWAGSELSAALLRPMRDDVEVVPYGLDPIAAAQPIASPSQRLLRLASLATIEPRKGQDLLVAAVAMLAPAVRAAIHVDLYGRMTHPEFGADVCAAAAGLPVTIPGSLDRDGYRAAVLACDAVVVPSRDDTLPLVSLDALGVGRVLICTSTTGTAAYLENGVSGFVASEPTAAAIATALKEALARREDWPAIAAAGRAVFARHFSKDVFAARLRDTIAALAS